MEVNGGANRPFRSTALGPLTFGAQPLVQCAIAISPFPRLKSRLAGHLPLEAFDFFYPSFSLLGRKTIRLLRMQFGGRQADMIFMPQPLLFSVSAGLASS